MQETWREKLQRWRFNLLPSFRGSGGWITYLSLDWREVHVKLPLNWLTRNYVGTTYCGSLYSAFAPFYVAMVHFNLPEGHIAWDKSVTVHFKKPGRDTLYAKMKLEQAEIDSILDDLQVKRATERTYTVDIMNAEGDIHVSFDEVVYIRRPSPAVRQRS